MQHPREKHLAAATRVLRYLKCTAGQGLFYPSNNSLVLTGYCDSDWGSCPTSRKSVTSFCLLLGSSLNSWQSKKQSVTSRSTAEAEYRALATTTCEVLWLHSLLQDLQVTVTGPTPIHFDNKATTYIAENPVYHARTKHIELDCHFVREKVQAGIISPVKVASKDQLADLLTKALGKVPHWFLASKLGLHNPCAPPTCGGSNRANMVTNIAEATRVGIMSRATSPAIVL